MARGLRTFLLALVSLGSLLATLYLVGVETVIVTLRSIHWLGIVIAALLILSNSLLSLLRFRSVLHGFGFTPGWRSLFFAHSIGQVSNQILLNVIGQSLSRAAALAADGVPFSVSVIATYWERIQAAAILFLLSLVSLWYLFVNIHFDLMPAGLSMLSLSGALIITFIVVGVTVLRPAGLFDNAADRLRSLLRLWPSLLLTLLAHGCMLGAYLSLLWGLGITQVDGGILAALIIVMFTSSLPISFSGWGIRELSAAQALGAVGVQESSAVASAVAIGLLYLFLVVVFAAISTIIVVRHRRKYAAAQPVAAGPSIDWSSLGVIACSLLCAVLLFFQLRIPHSSGEATANIADLIALTSLGLAPYFLWTHRNTLPLPKVLLIGLAAISAVMVYSLLYGYSHYGWTNWAFLNRGLGWLIILGYVATGLSITMTGSEQHRRVILAAFVAAGTAIAVMQLILLLVIVFGFRIPRDIFFLPLQGYAGNTNAFAVQMVMTAAAAIAAHHLGIFGQRKYLLPLILSLVGSSIYFCHSRAGLGMFAIALAVMMMFPANTSRRSLLPALVWPILAMIFCSYLYVIYGFILVTIPKLYPTIVGPGAVGGDSNYVAIITGMLQVSMERQSGDLERWTSIIEGWEMWLESPVIGNGLGAYMQHRLATTGEALIIHSVPVWLLAETGLVGSIVVASSFATLLFYTYRQLAQPAAQGWAVGLLIALICIGAGSAVHDFFFQRSFWFLLGLFIAIPAARRPTAG